MVTVCSKCCTRPAVRRPGTAADSARPRQLSARLAAAHVAAADCSPAWSCGVVVITSALHAEGPQFDPGRDQNFLSRPNCKYQDQYWIVFNISKLSYSAHLCHPKLALPHHKHYRGSVSPDVSARHYPAVLSHTQGQGCL